MEQLYPFGLGSLPVWVSEEVYREYETVVETVEPEAAVDEGMIALSAMIKEKTLGRELISKEIRTRIDGGCVYIDCLLYVNADIGETVEAVLNNDKANG